MSNPAKKKGSRFEVAVRDYLAERGFQCRRQALAGKDDQGDLLIQGDVMDVALECKNRGSMSPKWLMSLLDEAEEEAFNAEASYGIAVVHRAGRGERRTGDSFVLMSLSTLADLLELAGRR